MTIAVNIVVPEGIVFAADSRLTYTNARGEARVSSDRGQKLFQIGPRAAAVTYGWPQLRNRNIHSHINDYYVSLGQHVPGIEALAKGLGLYLTDQYKQHVERNIGKPAEERDYALALLVGGFDPGDKTGRVFEVFVPPGEPHLLRTTDEKVGAGWRGQATPIIRLLKGYDLRINQLSGFTPELEKSLQEAKLDYAFNYMSMTLPDAVDMAEFLVHTTIQIQRFSDGIRLSPGASANCGGPIEIAVIEPNNGFQWIQHKSLRGERVSAVDRNRET